MNSSLSRIVAALLILIFGLLALYYGVKYNQLKKTTDSYLVEKNQVNEEYDELTQEFENLRVEFLELEESNLELNSEMETKRADLIKQKDEVSRLLRKERLTKTELDRARAMIQELKNEKNALLTQLKSLGEENNALKEENKNYSRTLTTVFKEKETLVAKQDSLEVETTKLVETNKQLEEKQKEEAPMVEFAKVVPVKSVLARGVKYKNSGKEKETTNNKKVDKLKINFTVDKNPVAENGVKEYLVRIISPDGTIVYDEARGSGGFNEAETGQGMKFTMKTNIDYDGAEKQVALFWRQDYAYQEGLYQIEVFNRGYKVGESQFELR